MHAGATFVLQCLLLFVFLSHHLLTTQIYQFYYCVCAREEI